MNINEIKELILTMDKTSIQKIDLETKDAKLSLSKAVEVAAPVQSLQAAPVQNVTAEPASAVEAAPVSFESEEDFYIVKSPIVGVFYSSPSPDSPAFAKVGDKVEKGQIVCIVEAMKLMNEIETEESGEIVEILVSNEEPVEFGQPLMKVRR